MFDKINTTNHETIIHHYDMSTNLKTIVGIHNTTLGPALGGVRIWNYQSETAALEDVLRLSSGMTYKAAFAGLDCGGGKAVIIGDVNKIKTETLLRSFGRFVDSLGGSYITAPDVNTNINDLALVAKETKYATGLPEYCGGSDDPSEFTAYGVLVGMKAAVKYLWGTDSLKGKKISVEGVGKVGKFLVKSLCDNGADVYVTDISKEAIKFITQNYNVTYIEPKDFYNLSVDIYSPCALGGTLNDKTIEQLNCKIIAGGANNQPLDPIKHSDKLKNKGILYIPDFVLNTGGLINVYNEYIGNYNRKATFNQVEQVYNRCINLFEKSYSNKLSTHLVAESLCTKKIESLREAGLAYCKS